MAKRLGMDSPEVRARRERERLRREAEYRARLMPEPGTAAWEQGLELTTPFFDIMTAGIGGLGMKGAAKVGGLLSKKKPSGGLLEPKPKEQWSGIDPDDPPQSYFDDLREWNRSYREEVSDLEAHNALFLRDEPPKLRLANQSDTPSYAHEKSIPITDYVGNVRYVDFNTSPLQYSQESFEALDRKFAAKLLLKHGVTVKELYRKFYKEGGRAEYTEALDALIHYPDYYIERYGMDWYRSSKRTLKKQLDESDREFGFNIIGIDE